MLQYNQDKTKQTKNNYTIKGDYQNENEKLDKETTYRL